MCFFFSFSVSVSVSEKFNTVWNSHQKLFSNWWTIAMLIGTVRMRIGSMEWLATAREDGKKLFTFDLRVAKIVLINFTRFIGKGYHCHLFFFFGPLWHLRYDFCIMHHCTSPLLKCNFQHWSRNWCVAMINIFKVKISSKRMSFKLYAPSRSVFHSDWHC